MSQRYFLRAFVYLLPILLLCPSLLNFSSRTHYPRLRTAALRGFFKNANSNCCVGAPDPPIASLLFLREGENVRPSLSCRIKQPTHQKTRLYLAALINYSTLAPLSFIDPTM
uniref:Uncharacterized protein n=1 Tax=Cacopsylla melanoneura TaxID=428564 RepID=A0A8D8XFX1_9HEMI